MKRLVFNFWICLLIGVMAMGCVKSVRYATYQNKKPEFGFSLQYPENWVVSEFKEPKLGFAVVTFTDKKDIEGEFQPHFVVTAKKNKALGVVQDSIEAVAEDALKKGLKHENAQVLSKATVSVASQAVTEATITYIGSSDIYSAKARPVLIYENILVVHKGGMYYIIRYLNTRDDFPRLKPIFQHALKTFKFI